MLEELTAAGGVHPEGLHIGGLLADIRDHAHHGDHIRVVLHFVHKLRDDLQVLLPAYGIAFTGGTEQINSRISYNEIDLVFYFRSTDHNAEATEAEQDLFRLCDVNNIPLATNIATAEVLVTALEAGSFDWREFINPRSPYNQRKKSRV
jgi:methylglyoxal synthase